MARCYTCLRFLLGRNVKVGRRYRGWETLDDFNYDGYCRVVRYDGTYVFVYDEEKARITLLCGDVANYRGRIVADRHFGGYSIRKMHKKVLRYMEEHGIAQYDSSVGRKALWIKMVSDNFIQLMVEVYETGMTLLDQESSMAE